MKACFIFVMIFFSFISCTSQKTNQRSTNIKNYIDSQGTSPDGMIPGDALKNLPDNRVKAPSVKPVESPQVKKLTTANPEGVNGGRGPR